MMKEICYQSHENPRGILARSFSWILFPSIYSSYIHQYVLCYHHLFKRCSPNREGNSIFQSPNELTQDLINSSTTEGGRQSQSLPHIRLQGLNEIIHKQSSYFRIPTFFPHATLTSSLSSLTKPFFITLFLATSHYTGKAKSLTVLKLFTLLPFIPFIFRTNYPVPIWA